MKFDAAFKYKLIYIFSIPDAAHRGRLKIGDTTLTTDRRADSFPPNCRALNAAANERIKQYTTTAGIAFNLLYTELAVEGDKSFRDYHVHRVLKRYRTNLRGSKGREWFRIDLDTAIAAIKTVKDKLAAKTLETPDDIDFRPEQEEAIALTVKHFKKGNDFLWNAKMRFGKTLCALEVVKRMNFAKTIVITHRPVVNANWFEDFPKIFHGDTGFDFGSKFQGKTLNQLLASGKNFVYFASIQDLRGSDVVGGKVKKNSDVFNKDLDWDFVIIDEAHEGTTTKIGKNVIAQLIKPTTKRLELSGTPFNLLERYGDNVFTWDYVSEQKAKADWDEEHGGDSNPYDDLPKMNIYTYDLGKAFNYIDDDDKAFNFREFFSTDKRGRFVHKRDVKKFLDMLGMESDNNYPFSKPAFRELFKHTLWIVPGVKEGRALSAMLKDHPAFCYYEIVNVAGDGDDDNNYTNALELVKDAIAANEFTITLSCGKLTTGVTVPQWTAVLYLAGGKATSAASYLQTIFRVQSPCRLGGKVKTNCFVFDFAPDRTLRMITEAATISPKAGKTKDGDRAVLGELLNFCPVISLSGSHMRYTADKLLTQLKRAWIERAARNGFDDNCLYNDKLLKLNDLDMKKFDDLKARIGSSATAAKDVDVNKQGVDKEKREKIDKAKRELTPEQKELAKQKRKRLKAISILRQVSIRMPLLIYGADVKLEDDITIDRFAALVDDASWEEFMPKGVTKEIFADFVEYYDPDIFIGTGNEVRERAKAADDLNPTARVKAIAALFATFKNPDKETVLTPWRVVNLHLASVFGGCFFDDTDKPCRIHSDDFTPESKILEINSKTGLYPLYVAYSIYRARLEAKNLVEDNTPLAECRRLWDLTVANNVFALCKTPMAEKITQRTLRGYRDKVVVHAKHFPNIIDTLKNNPQVFFKQITNAQFWSKGVGKMFFDAVVGNPPYQSTTSTGNFNPPIYHLFLKTAFNLADRVSLIHPARCLFNAGATPKEFNQEMLCDKHIKIVRYFPDSTKYISDEDSEKKLFPDSDIKGGIVITLRDANQNFGAIGTFIPFEELRGIHQKVCVDNPNFQPLSDIVFSKTIYRLTKKFHDDNPDAIKIISEGHANDFATSLIETFTDLFFDEKPDDGREYIQAYGRLNNVRVCKYFRRDWVNNPTPLEKWKVLVPESNGSGALGEVLVTPLVGSPLVGSPLVGHTETFISVGAFDTEAEAQACLAYIKTRFCRAMLGILKVTQHNPPATWAKVPLQDFTTGSDIDWSLSVTELDERLFDKYGLTAAEREFILSHVKEMD